MTARSERTRSQIYQAALTEFAEHGIAGARVDRIAEQAQANKQAIYRYFGDKEQLFATVLEGTLSELAAAVPPAGPDGTVAAADYVDRLLAYHQSHPEVLRLLLWEALEYRDRAVPDEAARAAHYRQKSEALAGARTPGSEQAKAIDPATLMLIFTGLVGWPLAVPQVRRMMVGDGPEAMERVRRAAIAAAELITQA
ncbi:TetR/AcrR family transcriptional regulator [Kitasatospora viridis]|uniref:TetR family transcriptional regulator n=1 Tax=Kitasatospora viridis TaxID=281105 RepID=A0A561UBH8_9ACTN|nr:TetR family transcriptional regulator [Kitasatospora viridis]TWF96721.1 TetR family transcriptional regulator [Kitasatospora viridis]